MASDSDSPDSSSYSNKRHKVVLGPNSETLTLNDQPESQEHQNSIKLMEESYFLSCGICLLEEGKSIRGQIDSCYHYFCFVCIMEWAKIESRCPLCKRRFTTIRRPPKQGVFPYERIVNVPQRDQVYHRFGNATVGPFDPYAHVQCNVCQGTNDDSLLLLCDLCDLAAHTYCVGLGVTVPEGDWFCHDCAILRDEHNNAETDTDGDNQNVFEHSGTVHGNTETENNGGCQTIFENSESEHVNAETHENTDVMPQADAYVSIYDIVHEELDQMLNWRRPHPRASSSLPVVSGVGITVANEVTLSQPCQNIAGKPPELGARTLHTCRNVHSRIQKLRENWNALQNGSLSFASSSVESGGNSSTRHNISQASHDRSGQLHSLTSRSGEQLRALDGSSGDIVHNNDRSAHDIDTAWKMMKIAKSMQQNCERANRVHLTSKSKHPFSSVRGEAPKHATSRSPSLQLGNRKQSGNSVLGIIGTEKHGKCNSLESKIENHRSLKSESQKPNTVVAVKSSEGRPTTHTSRLLESSSFRKAQTQCDIRHVSRASLLAKSSYGASSSASHEQGGSFCSTNLVGSLPETSDSCSSKPDFCIVSFGKVDNLEGKGGLGKGCAESKAREADDAKSEIRSLVKLNLKLLSRGKQLGLDAFKEVARLATHTILAACGLEHSKSGIRFFPSSEVCSHTEHMERLRKSTLMPNCCRECFYTFVKDVVNSIMLEKLDNGKSC